jgi:ABC-2 type transport system ATP-binding protein
VELRNVSKVFGSVRALQDVTFSVRQGEVVALLGPNGAGKTTTISIMLGLRRATAGQVQLFGLDPGDARARSRRGVMLQESGIPMTLTVRELIDLFRSYYPAPLPAAQVIAMAGLEEKSRARAGSLSGGQRQRLYFALAVCGDPEVLFLDEPTAALDVQGRRDFWAQVRGFAQAGKTVLLTTHYLEEADALADRVVVIDHGRVIADAPPATIKARVAGKRVSFAVNAPLDATAFAGLPAQSVEQSAHHVKFVSTEPETVLQALFARGVALHGLEIVGADLEEAFITLTKEEGE